MAAVERDSGQFEDEQQQEVYSLMNRCFNTHHFINRGWIFLRSTC